jgi:hypothetical protein
VEVGETGVGVYDRIPLLCERGAIEGCWENGEIIGGTVLAVELQNFFPTLNGRISSTPKRVSEVAYKGS